MRELLTSCLSLSDKFSKEDENVEGVEEDDVVFDGHSREVQA